MTRTIYCLKLQKEAEGLDTQPFPNALGKKLYENISRQAWQEWVGQQTMLINENRLNLADPNAQKFLMKEMEKFLFGE